MQERGVIFERGETYPPSTYCMTHTGTVRTLPPLVFFPRAWITAAAMATGTGRARARTLQGKEIVPAHVHRLAPIQEGLHFLELAVYEMQAAGEIDDLEALFAPRDEKEILALSKLLCTVYENSAEEASVALRQNSTVLSLLSPRCKNHVVAVASLVRSEMERRAIPLVSQDHCRSFRELFPEDSEGYGIMDAREEGLVYAPCHSKPSQETRARA